MSFESSSSSRLCQLNQRLKIKALGSKSWRGSILGILIVKDAVSGVLVNFINFKQVIMILIWNGRRICIAFRQRQDNLECFICFFFFTSSTFFICTTSFVCIRGFFYLCFFLIISFCKSLGEGYKKSFVSHFRDWWIRTEQ